MCVSNGWWRQVRSLMGRGPSQAEAQAAKVDRERRLRIAQSIENADARVRAIMAIRDEARTWGGIVSAA